MTKQTGFKTTDAGSYDDVVDSFDRYTESYTTPLARHMLKLAGIEPGEEVLDVGTGTAVVAFMAAGAAETALHRGRGRVLGVDLSEGMLAACRSKEERLKSGAEFRKMDAESLDLESGSFDVVLSLFALTHFPNPQKALEEMHRVLRPGGRLVVAAGSGPPLLSIAGWVHRIGKLKDRALEPLGKRLIAPRSLLSWLRARAELLEEHGQEHTGWAQQHGNRSAILPRWVAAAGFEAARADWMGCKAVLERAEDFWEIQATNSSTLRKCLARHSDAKRSQLRADYLLHCQRVQQASGSLVYPYGAVFISAAKPKQPG